MALYVVTYHTFSEPWLQELLSFGTKSLAHRFSLPAFRRNLLVLSSVKKHVADYSKHGSRTFGNIGKDLPNYTASSPRSVQSDSTNFIPQRVRRGFYIIIGYGSYDAVAQRTSGHNSWSSHTVVAALWIMAAYCIISVFWWQMIPPAMEKRSPTAAGGFSLCNMKSPGPNLRAVCHHLLHGLYISKIIFIHTGVQKYIH